MIFFFGKEVQFNELKYTGKEVKSYMCGVVSNTI